MTLTGRDGFAGNAQLGGRGLGGQLSVQQPALALGAVA